MHAETGRAELDPIQKTSNVHTFAWPSMQVSRRPPATSTEPRASPFSNMSTSPVAAPTKARSSLSPARNAHTADSLRRSQSQQSCR